MTSEEHAALLNVRRALASGLLDRQFNMNQAISDCGTFACIGGHMAQLMGIKDDSGIRYYVSGHKELHDLFYPDFDGPTNWEDITPAQAVMAIDNFLTTGNPAWNEVIP